MASQTKADRPRWPLQEARTVAEELVSILSLWCDRIEVAGSIRRMAPTVGDIELLCVPKYGSRQINLFGDTTKVDLLSGGVQELMNQGVLAVRLNATGHKTFGELNKLMIHIPSSIPVDIFSTGLPNWGMALVVRTGPRDWNIRMMARFKELGMRGHAYGGVTDQDGRELLCPTEDEVFRLLKWSYKTPEHRR